MTYVIGIDVGTSSVKALLVDQQGNVCGESSAPYPLIQEKSGYSEQEPEQWVTQTILALRGLLQASGISGTEVEGISFSGQMHGLVLLDEHDQVVRNAILWNDTRTTNQCQEIEQVIGGRLLQIARNPALEGFTLPKILWVREHEPELFQRSSVFVLPKDYVRYRLTGHIAMDYSDAAGTLLLDITGKKWSADILQAFDLPESLCPTLVESGELVGTLLPEIAAQCGLTSAVKVFAGGADNACGAIGAGILTQGETMCSIGTSGVILSCEEEYSVDYAGKLHFFNHGKKDAYYAMGVTLAAGQSLTWFKHTFAPNQSFEELLQQLDRVPAGAGGLLFSPYLYGERTPHADALIRGSFIGMDGGHELAHFTRAVVEGITFSLRESVEILRTEGKTIQTIVSIGGGAKNETWLQIQADVFQAEVIRLESEQGPAMGAAMLAAVGCGWYPSLQDCARQFIRRTDAFQPRPEQAAAYEELYRLYKSIYPQTRELSRELAKFRR